MIWEIISKKFEAYLFFSKECAKRLAKVSAEAKLEIDEETYLSSFKPHLMDVVYTWATGATFAHICKMTDVFEGMVECSIYILLSDIRNILRMTLTYQKEYYIILNFG